MYFLFLIFTFLVEITVEQANLPVTLFREGTNPPVSKGNEFFSEPDRTL